MRQVFLGIDTSCYTTSAALLDEKGGLLADKRVLLKVKSAARGLRQSEMVFQHVKNLPVLMEEIFAARQFKLGAVGVSVKPRSAESSYMPAFMSGAAVARSAAAAAGAEVFSVSHQENHIRAGLWSAQGRPGAGSFLVLHLSGGTTDLLLAEKNEAALLLKELGGSSDLNAGQFIDRIGVAMGLDFPAGGRLERLAATAREEIAVPVSVKGLNLSYSGPLTAALRLLEKGAQPAALAAGIQKAIAESLGILLTNAARETGCADILLVGGVAANNYIRAWLERYLGASGLTAVFPEHVFCGDNAVGCAYIALEEWRRRHG